MTKRLYILPFLFCILLQANAQTHRVNRDGSNATLYDDGDTYLVSESGTYVDGAGNRTTWGRDTTKFRNLKNIPIGQFQWVLEPRLGTVIDAENNDTVVHDFSSTSTATTLPTSSSSSSPSASSEARYRTSASPTQRVPSPTSPTTPAATGRQAKTASEATLPPISTSWPALASRLTTTMA